MLEHSRYGFRPFSGHQSIENYGRIGLDFRASNVEVKTGKSTAPNSIPQSNGIAGAEPMSSASPLPQTLGELRKNSLYSEARWKDRSVKEEMRQNLILRLQSRETLFPGIVGYEDTVVPQIVNAVLSRRNFILLGLR